MGVRGGGRVLIVAREWDKEDVGDEDDLGDKGIEEDERNEGDNVEHGGMRG